jgi:hypothetical protein
MHDKDCHNLFSEGFMFDTEVSVPVFRNTVIFYSSGINSTGLSQMALRYLHQESNNKMIQVYHLQFYDFMSFVHIETFVGMKHLLKVFWGWL